MSLSKPLDTRPSEEIRLFIYSSNSGPIFVLAKAEEEAEKKIRKTDAGRDLFLIKQYEINQNAVVFSQNLIEHTTDPSGAIPVPVEEDKTIMSVPHSVKARRFYLLRRHDISGVSGTGKVAEGVEFADGRVCLRFFGEGSSTNNFDSLQDLLSKHGHEGATEAIFYDE